MMRRESMMTAFVVSLPLAAIMVVGFSGRSGTARPAPAYANSRGEARIDAYQVPVREAHQLEILKGKKPGLDQVLAVSQVWLDGYAQSQLQDLSPVFILDTTGNGVKREIFKMRHSLEDRLLYLGAEAVDSGNIKAAKQAYAMVIRLSEVAKYSDLASIQASSVRQERAINGLVAISSKIAPEEQLGLAKLIQEAQPNLERISACFHREYGLAEQSLTRTNSELSDAERDRLASLKDSIVANQIKSLELLKQVRRFGPARAPVMEVMSQARVAVHLERHRAELTRGALDLLDPAERIARRPIEPTKLAAR